MVACMVPNPAVPRPSSTSIGSAVENEFDRAKPMLIISPMTDPPRKIRPWYFIVPTLAMVMEPTIAPRPSAPMSRPIKPGPTPRESRAITGSICMYGNSSMFISTVTTTVARISRLPNT